MDELGRNCVPEMFYLGNFRVGRPATVTAPNLLSIYWAAARPNEKSPSTATRYKGLIKCPVRLREGA